MISDFLKRLRGQAPQPAPAPAQALTPAPTPPVLTQQLPVRSPAAPRPTRAHAETVRRSDDTPAPQNTTPPDNNAALFAAAVVIMSNNNAAAADCAAPAASSMDCSSPPADMGSFIGQYSAREMANMQTAYSAAPYVKARARAGRSFG